MELNVHQGGASLEKGTIKPYKWAPASKKERLGDRYSKLGHLQKAHQKSSSGSERFSSIGRKAAGPNKTRASENKSFRKKEAFKVRHEPLIII